jgi:hypothetical protein
VQKQFNWVNKGAKPPRLLKNLSLFSFAGFAPLREIMELTLDNVLFLVNKYCSYLLCSSKLSQLNSQTGIP